MNSIWIVLETLLISVVISVFLIPKILLISYKKRLFDMPDARKVHQAPVPRLGGLSFMPVVVTSLCGACATWFMWGSVDFIALQPQIIETLFFLVGMMMLYFVGLADDLVGVGYRYKFVAQILAACMLLIPGLWINNFDGILWIYEIPDWFGMLATIFFVVYVINAINLIDGIDGLASGMSCIALAILGIAYLALGYYLHAILTFGTLGVTFVFWFYNVFRIRGRKFFMGDCGSLTLGFTISFLVLHFWRETPHFNPFEYKLNMVALGTIAIPLLDVVRVFYARIRAHKNPFLPDKNHIHHKLMRTGMRVRWVLVTLLLLSGLVVVTNYWLAFYLNSLLILLVDLLIWYLFHKILNYFIRRRAAK